MEKFNSNTKNLKKKIIQKRTQKLTNKQMCKHKHNDTLFCSTICMLETTQR